MAKVTFTLVVQTADGLEKVTFNPTVKKPKSIQDALTQVLSTDSDFSFLTETSFGVTYLTKVTFGTHVHGKADNNFWQILLNQNHILTPIGLEGYTPRDNDQIILSYMTVKP